MVRGHVLTSRVLFKIAGYILILILAGCASEYGSVGPSLEGASSITGGTMEPIAGMPGGTGTADGTGSAARFNSPRGIVAYGSVLIIADQNNHTIRTVEKETGKVTTVTGLPGFSGVDDGVGKNARFNAPEGIETDGKYLYIADTGNHAIRKLEISTLNVTTLAGKRGQIGSEDGAGPEASFNGPTAMTLLGDFLYITDTDNHTIRRVDKNTGSTITVAGAAGQSGSADGIHEAARFYYPLGIATDGRYLFIADTYNHTIRILSPVTGEVSTVAGKAGTKDYKDGPLTGSRFYYPYGLAVRGGGEIYVADLGNNLIRVIDLSSGTTSTISGTPLTAGSADGPAGGGFFYGPSDVAAAGDNIYVTDKNNHTIRKVDLVSGDTTTIAGRPPSRGIADGVGEEGMFYTPGGIAKDGDMLYVADTFNHTIRKVDIMTGEVITIAGTPGVEGNSDSSESPALFSSPGDVIADETGENIFIVDTNNHVIRRMKLSTGEIRTLVGYPGASGRQDGVGVSYNTSARFNSPKRGLRIGGKLFVADTGNHVIRVIDVPTATVSTLAGESGVAGFADTGQGTTGKARFNSPGDLTTDGTFLYVADTGNHVIRRVAPWTGTVVTIAGTPGKSGLLDSKDGAPMFNAPEGIAWDDGILYISDTGNHLIRKFNLVTKEVSFLAGDMSCIKQSETTSGVVTETVTCTAQPLGVSSYGDSSDGTGKTTSFRGPTAINVDGTYLYVIGTGSNSIRKVDKNTGETKTFSFIKDKGISLNAPSGGDLIGNKLYLADKGNHIIRLLDITNLQEAPLIVIAGTVGMAGYRYSAGYSAQFNRPVGIVADGQGNLYVADTANHTIRKVVLSNREVTTVVGTPGVGGFMDSAFGSPLFNNPRGICIIGDHLYVSDSGNHLIRRVNLHNGYVGLVAGLSDYVKNVGSSGTSDSTGAASGFNDPRGIAADGLYLYVSDTGNHTIRRVLSSTGQVKTIAGMPQSAGYKDGVGFSARFRYPRGLAVDGDYIYVADSGNNVMRRVNKNTGEVLTFSGQQGQASFIPGDRSEARYNNIVSMVTDPSTPYIYFTDSFENVIGKVTK